MFPQKDQKRTQFGPVSSPFGEPGGHANGGPSMALLALSHTPVEHHIYQAMLSETAAAETRVGAFSTRRLMMLTGLQGYSTIRRGIAGLLSKQSIERYRVAGDGASQQLGTVYFVFNPEEVFARRKAAGLAPYPKEVEAYEGSRAFGLAIERVVGLDNLSRREAQVALCCAEGLTNAEIGEKLHVTEQTVKFHLRHIFVKFGVKRRAELVSRLLCRNT